MELKNQNKTGLGLIILNYDVFSNSKGNGNTSDADRSLLNFFNLILTKGNYKLIIVSEENKESLEKQFGQLDCTLIAENGAIFKEDGEWKTDFSGNTFWKKNLEPLFGAITQNCPESFLEEKDHSLIWNYKNVEPKTGLIYSEQLKRTLENIVHFYNLKIIAHKNTIEVMSMEISRAKTIRHIQDKGTFSSIYWLCENITDGEIPELSMKSVTSSGQANNGSVSPALKKASDTGEAMEILHQLSL